VLPPAREPIFFSSGGLLGPGGEGGACFSVRRCRLGPSISWFSFPGDVGEAAAAAASRNKSLQPRPRLACAHSGANEGCVGAESTGVGSFAVALFPLALDRSDVGVSSAAAQGMWLLLTTRCRKLAGGFMDERWMGLGVFLAGFQWCVQAHGQRSMGCVPGRCVFSGSFYCGSFESLCAMVFLLILASLLSSIFGGAAAGEEERRRTAARRCPEVPLDCSVIDLLVRVFCAKTGGQLCYLYRSRTFLYLYCAVSVSLV